LWEIADRLEAVAQALKAISDPTIKQHLIYEMRTLLAEAEQKL
jgi:metal-sulfur cluster biosynthetic enzyme